jgi:hypothetical protein
MDPIAEQLLDSLAEVANKPALQPEEWQRLYILTVHVHRKRLPITAWDVRTHLFAHGCSPENVARYSAEFARFRELLTVYDSYSQPLHETEGLA